MTGRIYDPRTEPTAVEWALAVRLPLLPLSSTRAVGHVVTYREGILEIFDALAASWAELAALDADFAVRRRAGVFALELQEAIDVVRGNVPSRAVRLVVKERNQHEP